MKKFIVSLAVTLCVLASAGTVFAAENEPVLNTQSVPDVSSDTQVSDQIAIVYKDNGNIGDLGLTTGEVKEATSVSDKVDVVKKEDGQDTNALISKIEANDNVESAFVDMNIPLQSGIPDDPLINQSKYVYKLTGLDNTWDTKKNNTAIKVAVIDSGCSQEAPDLNGRTEAVNDLYGQLHPDSKGDDLNAHGTEVTGVLASIAGNGIGTAGSAGLLNVTAVPYRCGGTNQEDSELNLSCVIAAIKDATTRDDIKILNLSFGVLDNGGETNTAAINAMKQPVADAVAAGKIVIAAAGNNASNKYYMYPASWDGVISVGSVNGSENHSTFSNANDKVDVVAPGERIYSTHLWGYYEDVEGTSFSTPIVSGEAAALLAKNASLTADEVTAAITGNTKDLGDTGKDDQYGYGMIQVDKALDAVESDFKMTYTASEDDGKTIEQMLPVTYSIDATGGSKPYTYSLTWNGKNIPAETDGGNTFKTYPEGAGGESDTVILTVKDATGESRTQTFHYAVNDALQGYTLKTDKESGQSVGTPIVLNTQGAYGVSPYTYQFAAIKDGVETVIKDYDAANTAEWTPQEAGDYTLRAYIKGANDHVVTKEKVFTITGNTGTGLTGLTVNPSTLTLKAGETGSLSAGKTPASNTDSVSWTSSNTSVATVDNTGKVTAVNAGSTTVTASCAGKTASCAVTVAATDSKTQSVTYRTHVQDHGWQSYVSNGQTSGTVGQAKRLEGINISLNNKEYSGHIRYKTHIQNIGWESNWNYDGNMSGTQGRALRLEAIQIELTDAMKDNYDVYYRVHSENIGWMGWAKNGESAGTANYGYRLEGIQIVLVPKGGAAPGRTSGAFVQK